MLRVAIGAPLVREVAAEESLGGRLESRTAWLDGRVSTLVREIDALLEPRAV